MTATTLDRVSDDAHNLGNLIEDFRISWFELLFNVMAIVVLIGVFAAVAIVRFPQMLAPRDQWQLVTFALGTAIVLGGSIWAWLTISRMVANRHMRVLVFEDGFVSFKREQVFASRWEDVESAQEEFLKEGEAVFRHFRVRNRAGEEWVLSQKTDLIRDFPRLIDTIQKRLACLRLPAALAELKAGKTLDCGALKLTPQGIADGSKLLPWAEVHSVDYKDGQINIEKRGSWFSWAAVFGGSLTDKHLFLAAAEAMMQERYTMGAR